MRALPLAAALLAAALLAAAAAATAQTAYDVFVDGIHPARISVDDDGRGGAYRYGDGPGEALALAGACDRLACALTAVDSALSVRFTRSPTSLEGVLRLGDGRELLLVGTRRYAGADAPLPDACAGGLWLRGYRSADEGYDLALARLPAGRLAGTLHVRALATSFPASGAVDADGALALDLTRVDGAPAGHLAAEPADSGALAVTLALDAGDGRAAEVPLALARTDDLALGCLQAGGTRDLAFPRVGVARADLELGRRVRLWWSALTEEAAAGARASGWFEPVRLGEDYLSGWQHLRLPDGRAESHAVTVDRARGRLLRGTASLAGSRREREALRTEARARAEAAHPLADDPAFRAWAADQSLAEFVVAREGLTFGGEHHPVYGQLRWTEPWDALAPSRGLVDLLPEWLRGWVGGVPAEREGGE